MSTESKIIPQHASAEESRMTYRLMQNINSAAKTLPTNVPVLPGSTPYILINDGLRRRQSGNQLFAERNANQQLLSVLIADMFPMHAVARKEYGGYMLVWQGESLQKVQIPGPIDPLYSFSVAHLPEKVRKPALQIINKTGFWVEGSVLFQPGFLSRNAGKSYMDARTIYATPDLRMSDPSYYEQPWSRVLTRKDFDTSLKDKYGIDCKDPYQLVSEIRKMGWAINGFCLGQNKLSHGRLAALLGYFDLLPPSTAQTSDDCLPETTVLWRNHFGNIFSAVEYPADSYRTSLEYYIRTCRIEIVNFLDQYKSELMQM